jgi:hypothetical protein
MNKVEFTEAEIDIIIKGLESWESNFGNAVMGGMMEMLLPKETRESEEFLATKAEREAKEKRESSLRKEQAIMLKAKLIQLKQKVAVSDLAAIS